MRTLYCIYKDMKYKAVYRNGIVRITSPTQMDGFKNYIDVLGREHSELFIKELTLKEVDLLFFEQIKLLYQGIYFELFTSTIKTEDVMDDKFMIFTDSETLAQKYTFEKKEQFVYFKYIKKNQIDKIKLEIIPMEGFGNPRDIVIDKEDIDEWLMQIV